MELKGANITLRFRVISQLEKKTFNELINKLPQNYDYISYKNDEIVLPNGKKTNKYREQNNLVYETKMENIFDVEECNKYFIENWVLYKEKLIELKTEFKFSLILYYEITLLNFEYYPSFCFKPIFSSLIADLNIELIIFLND